MFEKFSPIDAVSEEIRSLRAGTILSRNIEGTHEMLPLGESIGLENVEEPPSVADVPMAVFQNETDSFALRARCHAAKAPTT